MKVKDLIKELEQYNQDLKVKIHVTGHSEDLNIRSTGTEGTIKIGYTVVIYC